MKNYLLLALICLSCLSALGQSESVWVQSGKVIDAKSHKPIAHVSVTDRKVGTVTNEEGEFTLKLKSEPKEIVFSCIGYQTRRLSPEVLKTTANKIMMTPSSVVLSEVVVKAYDAKALVMNAIDKIIDNYPQKPNLLKGFYRETVQKRNRFISIAEGVVDVYKTSYFKSDWRDGVAILKGRRLLSQRQNDTIAVKLQGGPVLPVQLDVVKEHDILLDAEELNNYSFRFLHSEKLDDRMQYVVEITPMFDLPYALYKGKLYIDEETLAFTKVDIELDMSNPDKVTTMILRKRPLGLRFTPREYSIHIDYKTDDGVTRINYIRNVIRFRCDWKRRVFKSNFTVTSEMVVTDRRDDDQIKPIKVRESFNRRDNFYDKVIYFEDPYFWGNENIIEPTEDLLEGIEKIKRRLK